jgi:hypothetical protein
MLIAFTFGAAIPGSFNSFGVCFTVEPDWNGIAVFTVAIVSISI